MEYHLGVLVLFKIIVLLMGCAVVAAESSKGADGTACSQGFHCTRSDTGYRSRNAAKDKHRISYDQRLEKAHALGADEVVNVRIDTMMTNPSGLSALITSTVNALAAGDTYSHPSIIG